MSYPKSGYGTPSALSDTYPSHIKFADTENLDGAGRLRISIPFSTFDQSLEFGLAQLFWDTDTSGAASAITHDGDTSEVILTCGTEADAYCVRQTFKYHRYRPGKCSLLESTAVFGAAVAGVTRRYGFFDAGDGIFFEQTGTEYAFTVRTSTSGSPSNAARVVRADWSLDKLDGTGPSGLDVDFTKGRILVIDLLWLGFGRVRVGFKIKGRTVYCHEFLHEEQDVPYMKTASLPFRYEIRNTALQVSNHTMRQGCVSHVVEDGQLDEDGLSFSANRGVTPLAVTTRRAVLSIRPAATVGPSAKINRIPIYPEEASLLVGTNDALVEIVYNPTFTGTPTWSAANSQSGVEYSIHGDVAAGAITDGTVAQSFYLAAAQGNVKTSLASTAVRRFPLTLDMDGANPKALSVVVTAITGTSNINAATTWKEVR